MHVLPQRLTVSIPCKISLTVQHLLQNLHFEQVKKIENKNKKRKKKQSHSVAARTNVTPLPGLSHTVRAILQSKGLDKSPARKVSPSLGVSVSGSCDALAHAERHTVKRLMLLTRTHWHKRCDIENSITEPTVHCFPERARYGATAAAVVRHHAALTE